MHHQSRGMVHHWSCGQLCMYWDKRKSPNVLEKGRWCGPAQVICQESRTIIWINHMNRLLRCAKENLRPVSMREFQSHATFNQTSSQEQLQQMARRLQEQLKSRSGLFQYADLSQIPTEETIENSTVEQESPSHGSQQTNQPEEEPVRFFLPNQGWETQPGLQKTCRQRHLWCNALLHYHHASSTRHLRAKMGMRDNCLLAHGWAGMVPNMAPCPSLACWIPGSN